MCIYMHELNISDIIGNTHFVKKKLIGFLKHSEMNNFFEIKYRGYITYTVYPCKLKHI